MCVVMYVYVNESAMLIGLKCFMAWYNITQNMYACVYIHFLIVVFVYFLMDACCGVYLFGLLCHQAI
jgi:hypothetical protein